MTDLAAYADRGHGVTSSGTGPLHLALFAQSVAPDSVVVASSMTFVAATNAIVSCEATPAFVDSEKSGNVDRAPLEHPVAREQTCGSN